MEPKPKNPAAVALGRLGGKEKSDQKAKSSAENGKKGGRPKKKIAPAVEPRWNRSN